MDQQLLDDFRRELKDGKAACKRLLAIPFPDPQGHIIGNPKGLQHPFKGASDKTAPLRGFLKFEQEMTDFLRKEKAAFPIGFCDAVADIVTPCAACGLYEWDVDARGIRPLVVCPFPDGIKATSVDISVPSGRLVVGVSMQTMFVRNKDVYKRLVTDFDGTLHCNHYGTKLWESYGFAEVQLFSQAEHFLYQTDNGGFVLSSTSPRKGRSLTADLFPFMPKFACCDADLFQPLYVKRRHLICKDAEFITVQTVPGTYRVRVVYGTKLPVIPVAGSGMRARVTIERIGEATPLPTIKELRTHAETFLASHPWLLTEYMKRRFKMRYDDQRGESKEESR